MTPVFKTVEKNFGENYSAVSILPSKLRESIENSQSCIYHEISNFMDAPLSTQQHG